MSYISKRYSKTANKCLNYDDPNQESKHIIYLERNNFYGYAMSKFLKILKSLTWISIPKIVQTVVS